MDEFRALDPGRATILKAPVLVELRNIYLPEEVARYGVVHVATRTTEPASSRRSKRKRRGSLSG